MTESTADGSTLGQSQTGDPELGFAATMTLSALLTVCAAALLAHGTSDEGPYVPVAIACVLAVVCLQLVGRTRAVRDLTRRSEREGLSATQARQRAKETLNAWLR